MFKIVSKGQDVNGEERYQEYEIDSMKKAKEAIEEAKKCLVLLDFAILERLTVTDIENGFKVTDSKSDAWGIIVIEEVGA